MFDPKDSKTIGYHLFILPPEELFSPLQEEINRLAKEYNGAEFEPHLTLLARIPRADEADVVAKTEELAAQIAPFEIRVKDIFAEDAYFRALYLKADPNPKMEEYHQKALEVFGVEDVNVYMPHLSLYYGNVPESTKQEMIASLSLPPDITFVADKIYLYSTEGETKDWVCVGAYPLGHAQ